MKLQFLFYHEGEITERWLQESDIEGSYGTNPNEGKKMYNHR